MADGETSSSRSTSRPRSIPTARPTRRASHRFSEARADFEKRFLREALVRCRYPPDADGGRGRADPPGAVQAAEKTRDCETPGRIPLYSGRGLCYIRGMADHQG
ncbi:MAG: hypothetical protein MZV64_12640 [Ignavibacteriales bacterium]|nr:hypothetical protein [Ignavibacteriales bacterium]